MFDSRLECRDHTLSVGSLRGGAYPESQPPPLCISERLPCAASTFTATLAPGVAISLRPLTEETAQTSGSLVLTLSGHHRRALLADRGHMCVHSRQVNYTHLLPCDYSGTQDPLLR